MDKVTVKAILDDLFDDRRAALMARNYAEFWRIDAIIGEVKLRAVGPGDD